MSIEISQDIENYLRNNSSDSRLDKIQEVGKEIVDYGFLKREIADELTTMLVRRDQLHHQVRLTCLLSHYVHPVLPANGLQWKLSLS